ncbi:MAG: hypothetical protein OXI67_13075 [Candidatus Poribacteria bacterium]|nr:hypothetical protein [Candidatus Poribacteria bacterium]
MQNNVCIIDLSTTEIQIGVLTDEQFQTISPALPWKVGFRQENDDTLVACFGEEFDRLDLEVRFTELDVFFQEITDEKTLECLFNAFFEEIFHRQLPEQGYPIDWMLVYLITPHQWTLMHRQQLRTALKRLKIEGQVSFLKSSKVTLRGMLSQPLCLSIYYQKTLEDILTDANKCHLFMIDFARHDLVVYHTVYSRLEDNVSVELTDIMRFTDYCTDVGKKVSSVQKALQKVENDLSIAVGFSGRIDDTTKTIIELLRDQCNATFLEKQETAALLGGAELVRQFEEESSAKPLHFVYHYCFGVRLPDRNMVELIPKTWVPPYHQKKAFRFTGAPEKFDVHLYCGLSTTEYSDVHYLATLEVEPSTDRKYTLNSPMEFILSVTLDDTTNGTFAVILPDQQEQKLVEFTVPVLMD